MCKHDSGPVVFYKGFTRAFLDGDTDSSEQLLASAVQSVEEIERGKKLVLIDGVGYPAVGSICGISNADAAKALNASVVLIGKSGVGDAVDSYNLNARYDTILYLLLNFWCVMLVTLVMLVIGFLNSRAYVF